MQEVIYADVPVAGTTLPSFEIEKEVYIPLRNVCENLGINPQNEYRRIKNDPILSKAVVKMTTAFSSGQEQLCLPLKFFPGWVFKINLNGLANDARPMIEAIQIEGYEALYDYWVKGSAINPRFAATMEQTERLRVRNQLPKLLDRLETESHPEKRRIIYALVKSDCEAEGIAPPLPEAIAPSLRLYDEAEEVLEEIEGMIAEELIRNHHRKPEFIAIRAKEAAAAKGPNLSQFSRALKSHPRFVSLGSVNCADGQTRHCWRFRARDLFSDPQEP